MWLRSRLRWQAVEESRADRGDNHRGACGTSGMVSEHLSMCQHIHRKPMSALQCIALHYTYACVMSSPYSDMTR